jgi:hypothetical protein
MTARRSSSDPISRYLETGERTVWRHQPEARALFYNRLPSVIIVLLTTAGLVAIGWNVVGNALSPGPYALSAWMILPAGVALFFAVLLYFFLGTLWNHTRHLLDSWNTHYALTDRRFIVVSGRGIVDYDASYFRKMEPVSGKHGKQLLMFDWGVGRKRREYYRERIAGLPDAAKLERLIRDTLRA